MPETVGVSEKTPAFKHLAVWDSMMGSHDYYKKANQERAKEWGAPKNVCFFVGAKKEDGWMTYDDIHSEITRNNMETAFDRRGWGKP